MTHFTTRERGTDTVLRRPTTAGGRTRLVRFTPRPNRVHHSTFVLVEIALSSRDVLGHACSLTAGRAAIFLSHFRKFSLSRSALESKEFSAVQLDRSLNSLAFPSTFLSPFDSATECTTRVSGAIRRTTISAVVYHDVHQLRPERDRFSRTLPSFGEPAKDSLTFGFQSAGAVVCKCERRFMSLRPLIRYGTL